MVKRDAHIDVVFRNGLKDLEVLPPSDLWDDISPVIAQRKEAGYLFRIAAGVAALVSLGLLAYFAGMQTTSSLAEANTDNLPGVDRGFVEDVRVTVSGSEPAATIPLNNNGGNSAGINNLAIATAMADRSVMPDHLQGMNITAFAGEKAADEIILNRSNKVPEAIKTSLPDDFGFVSLEPVYLNEPVSNPESRWKIGAQVSPTYLSSNLKAANRDLSELTSNENAILSYSGGFSVTYSLGDRLSLQAGVYYSSLGREISGISSYSGFSEIAGSKSGRVFGVETTAGTINTTNKDFFLADISSDRIQSIYTADNFDPVKAELTPYGNSLQQSFEYLEIPFILSYKVIDRKIDFNIQGGMSYNYLLNNKTYAIGDGSKVLVGSTDNINKMLLSSALGMSVEYSFADRFSMSMGPSFRYYLNSGGAFSSGNPYTIGIFSGLFFKF